MAITSIESYQSNFTTDNILSVHNPLSFIVNVSYTGNAPDVLFCDVYDKDDVLLSRFRCIPYLDVSASIRQFLFKSDGVFRGFMDDLDDVIQTSGTLLEIVSMTKEFKLDFTDDSESLEIEIVAMHSSRQFSESPNLTGINESKTYCGTEGDPVYVYYYNSDEGDNISNIPSGGDELGLLDFDDEEFADFDDQLLTGLTI